MMPEKRTQSHAIVIGASIAGLLAARALTDYFERVTLIERDALPESPDFRAGVPQAHHFHALLARGQTIMDSFFPGLSQELTREGAPLLDWGRTMRFFSGGHWTAGYANGLVTNTVTRIRLEWEIRQRVAALPGVTFLERAEIECLLADPDTRSVSGVRVRLRDQQEEQDMSADLIVDASGRRSKAPEWLQSLGYEAPEETLINAYVGYATRWYEAPTNTDWTALVVASNPARGELRGGGVFRVEGNRMLAMMGGMNKDYPPTDEAGFLDYVRSLPTPALYEAIRDAKPVSTIYGYRYDGSRRRHYERLTRRPERFILVGDAVCSFNPIYGQGMSVAAIGAEVLRSLLQEFATAGRRDLIGFATTFQERLGSAVNDAWIMATGEDLRYPGTEGKRPGAFVRLVQRYTDQVVKACAADPTLARRFHRVMNMVDRPQALFQPAVGWRVLRYRFQLGARRANPG